MVELEGLVARFEHAGYQHSSEVLMVSAGLRVEPGDDVVTVCGDALDDAVTEAWGRAGMTPDEAVALTARRVLLDRAASVEYFAVERDDRFVAHCELRVVNGTAQVDALLTHPAWQRLGLGRAVLTTAVARADDLGCSLVFLRTDADDWPQTFYRRIGFTDLGVLHSFERRSSP